MAAVHSLSVVTRLLGLSIVFATNDWAAPIPQIVSLVGGRIKVKVDPGAYPATLKLARLVGSAVFAMNVVVSRRFLFDKFCWVAIRAIVSLADGMTIVRLVAVANPDTSNLTFLVLSTVFAINTVVSRRFLLEIVCCSARHVTMSAVLVSAGMVSVRAPAAAVALIVVVFVVPRIS